MATLKPDEAVKYLKEEIYPLYLTSNSNRKVIQVRYIGDKFRVEEYDIEGNHYSESLKLKEIKEYTEEKFLSYYKFQGFKTYKD